MTLTNYWWLLIWIAVIGIFFSVFVPLEPVRILGKIEYRWRIIPAFILTLPFIFWAGFRPDGFGDTFAYRLMFQNAPSSFIELSSYLVGTGKDKGFTILMTLFKVIVGNLDVVFFLAIAAFQIICLTITYRKYSSNFLISIFLFVASTDYLSWMFNGIRQFIAAAGFFACFGLLLKKKYALVICIVLCLSTIHASVLITIPILFVIQGKAWNKRTILFILAIGLIILFVDRFTPFLESMLTDTQYSDIVSDELWFNDDGTNILRLLVYSVPALLSLFGRRYVDEANDPIVNISVNASACTMILYALASVSSGIYIGRLPIYTSLFGYIALPWLLDNMFTKDSARIVKLVMILSYLVFFYYQIYITWGLM